MTSKKVEQETQTQQRFYFIKNTSYMVRCAQSRCPEGLGLGTHALTTIPVKMGYNCFTKEEMDIIRACEYTNNFLKEGDILRELDLNGIGEAKIMELLNEKFDLPKCDTRLDAITQESMLEYLFKTTQLESTRELIRNRMPAVGSKNDDHKFRPDKRSAI